MYLSTFEVAGGNAVVGARLGGDRVVDLQAVQTRRDGAPHPSLASMQALIEAGPPALDRVRRLLDHAAGHPEAVHAVTAVRLRAPLPRPVRMRNFSVYEEHVRRGVEAGVEMVAGRWIGRLNRRLGLVGVPRGWYRKPAYYKGNHLSVIGPGDDIVAPGYTKRLDYELELAFVVGRAGRDLAPARALDHVFGYTILNDVSARDVLASELMGRMGPAKGKDFDTSNVMGPWLVTRDEITDPGALAGVIRVNGKVVARCTTGGMHFGIDAMLAEASRGETLHPGEVFGAGACANGSGIEELRFLAIGDTVELELEPIGVLRNRVVR